MMRVNGKYLRKGGAPYHIVQERCYKLMINIRLTNTKGCVMSHFVAWDGKNIIDQPFMSRVNETFDRNDPKMSKKAFGKLYPKVDFLSWQITGVFELTGCSMK